MEGLRNARAFHFFCPELRTPFEEATVYICGVYLLPESPGRDLGYLDLLYAPKIFTPDNGGVND